MSHPKAMSHPEDEQLLRYADGESPARAAGEIRSHLEACWQCREQLEQLQNTVGECVRYRKNILQRHLPEPPAPWPDIYRGFAEIDAALDPGSFRERVARASAGADAQREPVGASGSGADGCLPAALPLSPDSFGAGGGVIAESCRRGGCASRDAPPDPDSNQRPQAYAGARILPTGRAAPIQALFQATHITIGTIR